MGKINVNRLQERVSVIELILPYPDKSLMPNRKNGAHWGKTSKAKQEVMKTCFYLTKEAMQGALFIKCDTYPLALTFYQADKRHRDLDNLLAAYKSNIDSVAQALGINDKQFEPITISRGYDTKSYTSIRIGE